MGLIGNVLTALYVGFPCPHAPGAFLQKPLRWLEAITKYRGTMVGGPNFGWDYCARVITEEEKAGMDLSSVVTAYNGSEPVRAGTLDYFYLRFAGRDSGGRPSSRVTGWLNQRYSFPAAPPRVRPKCSNSKATPSRTTAWS